MRELSYEVCRATKSTGRFGGMELEFYKVVLRANLRWKRSHWQEKTEAKGMETEGKLKLVCGDNFC